MRLDPSRRSPRTAATSGGRSTASAGRPQCAWCLRGGGEAQGKGRGVVARGCHGTMGGAGCCTRLHHASDAQAAGQPLQLRCKQPCLAPRGPPRRPGHAGASSACVRTPTRIKVPGRLGGDGVVAGVLVHEVPVDGRGGRGVGAGAKAVAPVAGCLRRGSRGGGWGAAAPRPAGLGTWPARPVTSQAGRGCCWASVAAACSRAGCCGRAGDGWAGAAGRRRGCMIWQRR
jgi:hypothetical protein